MTMIPNKGKLIHKNSNFEEVYGLNYFYEKYTHKYFPSLFGEKGRGKRKISKSLYKKILMEYLDIYFKEIYFSNGAAYFLYTGLLEKVKYSPRVILNKKIKKIIPASIGFMWYKRPSVLFSECCKFEKLTGTTNKLPMIEKIFKNNFDVNLIVNFEEAITKVRDNQNSFVP